MKSSFPQEILIQIGGYLDGDTKYKFNCLINYKVCCSHEYRIKKYSDGLSEFAEKGSIIRKMEIKELEKDLYHNYETCVECGFQACWNCISCNGDIPWMDSCYDCGKTYCSDCRVDNSLKEVFTSKCNRENCYYCSNGGCYNSKIESVCEDCYCNYSSSETDESSSADELE